MTLLILDFAPPALAESRDAWHEIRCELVTPLHGGCRQNTNEI